MTEPLLPRIVRCPACGGRSVYAANQPHRPFCSARCRGVDLGAWASESYRVGGGGDAGNDPEAGIDDAADPSGDPARPRDAG